jgi:hypothetical protein
VNKIAPASSSLLPLTKRVRTFIEAALSESTRRNFIVALADYREWCAEHGLTALPSSPMQVGAYLTDLFAVLKRGTLELGLAGIVAAHRQGGHELDTWHMAIRMVMRGLGRTAGVAQRCVGAATTDVI